MILNEFGQNILQAPARCKSISRNTDCVSVRRLNQAEVTWRLQLLRAGKSAGQVVLRRKIV